MVDACGICGRPVCRDHACALEAGVACPECAARTGQEGRGPSRWARRRHAYYGRHRYHPHYYGHDHYYSDDDYRTFDERDVVEHDAVSEDAASAMDEGDADFGEDYAET